jgi:drug/metabolite transporter (DMT)-like permease
MQALLFGMAAALAWGFHDLCVRFVSQRTSILSAMFTVLASGAILVGALSLALGGWEDLTLQASLLSGLSGLLFAGGTYGLYRAFAIGPVKLVAPIVGAFPILSVGFAMLRGQPVPWDSWAAVLVIVAGVGCVALFSSEDEESGINPAAVIWGIIGASGLAFTFMTGQEAAAQGAEIPALVLTRLAALSAVGLAVLSRRDFSRPPLRRMPVLLAMGALDALALGLVLYAGGLPRPEFAAVSSSLFGLITVILAWAILRERMTLAQWLSVGAAFCGIAYLGH